MAQFDLEAANAEAKQRLIRGLEGHGAHLTFEEAVGDFPQSLINQKPSNVPYTFWHQIEHIRICQWDIFRYIVDPQHVSPAWPHGYWPAQNATVDQSAWDQSIAEYNEDLRGLIRLVEREDTNVLAPVEHNAGRSIMGSALVVVDHAAYHLGEFVMGRQTLGAWKSAFS